ncbi:amidase [Streptomyces sp. NPDC008238]
MEAVARTALETAGAELNALTLPLFDPAPAHRADGPLGGVPFVVKDGGPFVRGVPFTLGSRALRGAVADADHDLMARFREAGLVALGQSTAPEFGLNFATEPVRYGPTRNPWDPARGVGGSSGGSAALVAAGAVPVAHANDAGGSIRIPASCCGLVGLKPGRGRTPCGPLTGEAAFGLQVEFAVTRTVRDAAALLDAVSGPGDGAKYPLPAPPAPYARAVRSDPGRLRVAVTTAAWTGTPVDPQVAAVAVDAAKVLEWIGHRVGEDAPRLDGDDLVEAAALGAFASGGALLRAAPRIDRSLLEAVSRAVLAETEACTALELMASMEAQHRVTRAVDRFFAGHDLLVTPTLGALPAPHGTLDHDDPRHTVRSWLRELFAYGPFTAAFNVSGHPAVSLPLGQSREGLPVGVQLVAAHGREDLLLAVAAQLEQAVPWRDRRPPFAVG